MHAAAIALVLAALASTASADDDGAHPAETSVRPRTSRYFGLSAFSSPRIDDVDGAPSEVTTWLVTRLALGMDYHFDSPFYLRGGLTLGVGGRAYQPGSSQYFAFGLEAGGGVEIGTHMRAAVRLGIETTNAAAVGLRFYPYDYVYVGVDLVHLDRSQSTVPVHETNIALGAGVEVPPGKWTIAVVGVALALAIATSAFDRYAAY